MYPFLFIHSICPFKDLCLMAIVEPKSTLLERRRFSVVPFSWPTCTAYKCIDMFCITTPNLILKIKRNGFFYLAAKPKKRKRILNERSPHSFYCDFICPLGEIYMFQYKVKLYCFEHIKVVINLMETIW